MASIPSRGHRIDIFLCHPNKASEKFWSLMVVGASFTVTEGSAEKTKQTQKTFDSAEKCELEAQRLIEEKLKKGYWQNTEPGSRESEGME